jgi:glycosyltransferase involved in cell wall biosynthesis
MSSRRILFLCQVLPYPLDAGPKTRAYYVLRYLAGKHQVTLLSFTRPADPPEAIEHLRQMCEKVIIVPMHRSLAQDGLAMMRSLVRKRSFIITRDESKEMKAALKRLVEEHPFDTIHSDQLWMAQYALAAKGYAIQNRPPRVILDQHNTVYLIPERMQANTRNPFLKVGLRREAALLKQFETKTCKAFDHVVCVSEKDQSLLERMVLNSTTNKKHLISTFTSIPICVDPSEIKKVEPLTNQPNILFIGGMHWPPNAEGMRWFAHEIMPKVLEMVPEARCFTIGKQPHADITNEKGIITPGFVEDLEPYWQQCRAFVVPLLSGGGMRVKILDAWAHGLPVISTTIGAEGIEAKDGENIMVADTAQEFAEKLVKLLKGEHAERLGEAGRATVESRYDWRKVYQEWDALYGG